MRSAADREEEIVAVSVRQFPVLLVTGVDSSLETQSQYSVLISHRGVLHVLSRVFRRPLIRSARKSKQVQNSLHVSVILSRCSSAQKFWGALRHVTLDSHLPVKRHANPIAVHVADINVHIFLQNIHKLI